jgi:hypothetical protein
VVFLGIGSPDDSCLAKLQTLDHELQSFPFPINWTLEVACDPVIWQQALRRADLPHTNTAFTGIKPRITVLNGAIFNDGANFYRHTLAHELGHIRCRCGDEAKAEQVGMAFLGSAEYLASLPAVTTVTGK